MISKAKIKYIRQLDSKKNRGREHRFVAEGAKAVGDLMETFHPHLLIYTDGWNRRDVSIPDDTECAVVSKEELSRASLLKHPQDVIAVMDFLPAEPLGAEQLKGQLTLALDGVQDPGNLGTIIRIADWFGISQIVCSNDTADIYNPKVVQATMGSLARVKVSYQNLAELTDSLPASFPIYGTLLDGDSIYSQQLTTEGLIIMGNEGNGISEDIRKRVNRRLLIPNYPAGRKTADSLNVAIATAIICSEFRRNGK